MGDVGEIKGRVSFEYDGGGIDKAKSDAQSLAEIAGGSLAEGANKASESLQGLDEQAGKSSESIGTLAENAGSLEKPFSNAVESISSVSEELGSNQAMIERTGKAYEALAKPVGETAVMLESVSEPMIAISKSAESMQKPLEELGGGFNIVEGSLSNVVPLLPQLADNLHSVSEELAPQTKSFDAYTSNINAFQDALANPAPFNAIRQHLNDTNQTWDDFASSMGSSKAEVFSTIRTQTEFTASIGQSAAAMDEYNQSAVQWGSTSSTMNETVAQGATQFQTMGENIVQANKGMSGFNDTVVQANKGMSEFVGYGVTGGEIGPSFNAYAGINRFGGVGAQIYGPDLLTPGMNEFGGVGTGQYLPPDPASMSGGGGAAMGFTESMGAAGTGITDFLSRAMMPLMAIQQITAIVGQVGQAIYDSAAIAEGPGAHGFGTFTGTVDAIGQAAQHTGSMFSEAFGQGILPALNAVNYQMNTGTNNADAFGKGVGIAAGVLGDLAMLPINPEGAFQGLVNYGAQLIGVQQPFQGPGASSGAAQYAQIQQQIAQIPIQLAVSTATMQAQASSPTYLAAQAYLGSQTSYAQLGQTTYNASHTTGMSAFDYTPQSYQLAMSGQIASMPYASSGISNVDINRAFFNSLPGGPDVFSGPQMNWNNRSTSDSQNATFGGSFGQSMQNIGSNIGNWWSNLFGGGDNGQTSNVQATWAGQGGCFPVGTQVLMADRATKPIETLRIGECVLAHDGTKQVVTTVLATIIYHSKCIYTLAFSDGNTLTLTDSHPVMTDRGWKSLSPDSTALENPGLPVTTLQIGDTIHTIGGTCTLEEVTRSGIADVYNITVDGEHTFYAENILVHNGKGSAIMQNIADASIPQMSLKGSNLIDSLASNFSGASMEHTFTATVNWAATGLSQNYTAAVNWAATGLSQAYTAAVSWAATGLSQAYTAAVSWASQGLQQAYTAVASWTAQNLEKPLIAVAQWAAQGLEKAYTAVANWTGENLIKPFVAAAQWAASGLENTFHGVTDWIGQNLEHTFTGIASWIGQNLNMNFSAGGMTPGFASGVNNFSGGFAMVGEGGPELVYLPQGSSVYPQTAGGFAGLNNQLSGNNGDMITVNVTHLINLDSRVIAQQTIPHIAPLSRLATGRRAG